MSPLAEDTLQNKENLSANLLMRYQVSCDVIHKSIQSLSEWHFSGKDLLESNEVIQNDTTQESYKCMLLFQMAELMQLALLLKLK